MSKDDFLLDDLDDEKTVEFIKNYLPQDLKEKFSDDQIYYFLDLIDEYYMESGVLDSSTDSDGFIDIDLDEIVEYVIKESKKDDMGEFDPEDILFVVQGEMEYGNSLGLVE
ncbi:hypothetical protein Bcop_0672 [Bacteroides coprosuis DSM 18011]|uniref:Uncharacterized protein n=2 Tax=Bacteroides TaxID=816 RepID=F3ZSF3_9BACE|nr:hypothetical protein Bcop_0672 [Bacteroides coprosuis DSM 18011]